MKKFLAFSLMVGFSVLGQSVAAQAGDCVLGDPVVVKTNVSDRVWEVLIKPIGQGTVTGEANPCQVFIIAAANLPSANIESIENLGRFPNDLQPNDAGLRAAKFRLTLGSAASSGFKDFRVRHLVGNNYKYITVNLP